MLYVSTYAHCFIFAKRRGLVMSSKNFLFESEPFKELVTSLNNCQNVNIYCGAGVSIDRTGASWESMINEIYKRAMAQNEIGTDELRDAVSDVIATLQDKRENNQVASVFCQFFSHIDEDEYLSEGELAMNTNNFIVPIIKDVLYKEGWSEGYLLRNVVLLSIFLSAIGKQVTLLTTNYDVYIEKKFLQLRKAWETYQPDQIKSLPKMKVRYIKPKLTGKKSFQVKKVSTINQPGEMGEIELIYLHGRVPPGDMDPDRKDLGKKPFSGIVVLDEVSYAHTRESTVGCLHNYFGKKNSTTLIVGASVTDTPLIDSLVSTRHKTLKILNNGKKQEIRNKFAISNPRVGDNLRSVNSGPQAESLSKGGVDMEEQVKRAYQYRASRLGIRYLYPIAHFQTAQLMEEVIVALSLSDVNKYEQSELSHANRMRQWRKHFLKSKYSSVDAHGVLDDLVKAFLDALPSYLKIDPSSIRAEIWLRLEEEERVLTLFSTSVGPLESPDLRRRETLSNSSTSISSVKAYLYGKPIVQDHHDLGGDKNSTRWQSFISVPIFLNISSNIEGSDRLLTTRPGVVTVCGLASADLKKNFSRLDSDHKEGILRTIIKHGQKICDQNP